MRGARLAQAYQPPTTLLRRAVPPSPTTHLGQVYLFPPPNTTGKLHLGHALTVTIQDSAVRFQRLLGKRVRWIFGTDHAGIATQTVVEKQLAKRAVTRHDLGRDAFVQEIYQWTNEHKGKISHQLQLLGASLDFDNEYFTLDKFHCDAVEHAFVTLHDRGLMHRKLRMVNYCYQLETCLSDLEVDQLALTGPTDYKLPGRGGEVAKLGVADDFAYPIEGEGEEIVVRTTRLETMWGDVAVAVHPEDAKLARHIGKRVQHPFLPGRTLPVIGDAQLVVAELGTGAVKVTPFHDENDFACAQRNGLPLGHNLYDGAGRMHQFEAPLSRFAMRERLRSELERKGLYRGLVPHAMTVPICSRTGDVIERLLKHQWFLDAGTLARRADAASLEQNMTFSPKDAQNVYRDWLARCGDWCVSRQLWWGHRIPAYRKRGSQEEEGWVVCRSRDEAVRRLGTEDVEQDEDVLDTWFSSGLLPLSVNGWPGAAGAAADKQKPLLTWMETGSDILFFWVARMAMLTVELDAANRLPFAHVHLHSLVRDSKGRKMSKSLGNVIDPMHVIEGVSHDALAREIAQGNLSAKEHAAALKEIKHTFPQGISQFGSDALRLALASYAGSQVITFDMSSVVSARLFCNKLWQAARFVEFKLDGQAAASSSSFTPVTLPEKWILHRLERAQQTCQVAYGEELDCDLASSTARRFIQEDLCDVYIEFNKLAEPNNALLLHVFKSALCLINPVMPNITLDLWDHFTDGSSTTTPMQWPTAPTSSASDAAQQVEADMALCLDICRAVRALRLRAPARRDFLLVGIAPTSSSSSSLGTIVDLAKRLTRVDSLDVVEVASSSSSSSTRVVEALEGRGHVEAIASQASLQADQELARKRHKEEAERIAKREAVVLRELQQLESRLASPAFLSKAPAAVLERVRKELLDCQNELAVLRGEDKP